MITRETGLRGGVPIAPTPFTPTGELDLEGQRRVLDCMVDQGVDGICILANYSEQFLLSDEERETLMRVCLDHVAGRVAGGRETLRRVSPAPAAGRVRFIVTPSHFGTAIAAERARRAKAAGAA